MDPVGLARVARPLVVGAGLALTASAPGANAGTEPAAAWVVADRDDDDLDGIPDGSAATVGGARSDLEPVPLALVGATVERVTGQGSARLLRGGVPLPWKSPRRGDLIQGVAPGRVTFELSRGGPIHVDVVDVFFTDGAGRRVDPARSHASLTRTPPERAPEAPSTPFDDPDALRLVVMAPSRLAIELATVSGDGRPLDALTPALAEAPCPEPGAPPGFRCLHADPLRLVLDDVDRRHPLVERRSLLGELGGALFARVRASAADPARKLQAIRVKGPRTSPVGPIERHRARVRAVVLRTTAGGPPAVGGTDAGALQIVRAELALASGVWGQCGLSFGPPEALDVRIANPPPAHLVSFGNDAGLPASGGEASFRVDGRPLSLVIPPRLAPGEVAAIFARVVERAHLAAVVSENARIAPGAMPSVDVSVRRADGQLAHVELVGKPTDATLTVEVGHVDLSDGLEHFTDMDSAAGTLEERTLIKAVEDADPRTIDVVVLPQFTGGGRIGESFISSDGSSLRNVVLFDRAGVRARRSSHTLAHELGHILLDQPGHPDDYGLDTPTLLMDSDASDGSAFGPRRITLDECARIVRQSGPSARLPLFERWPLGRLRY